MLHRFTLKLSGAAQELRASRVWWLLCCRLFCWTLMQYIHTFCWQQARQHTLCDAVHSTCCMSFKGEPLFVGSWSLPA